MVPDESGKRLHDRVTRGQGLSPQEQAQLEAWYAAQDRAEMESLGQDGSTDDLSSLQTQIDSALLELNGVTRRIQQTSQENEALRQEIKVFRRRLARQMVTQTT